MGTPKTKPKLNKVSVTIGKTINIGNFESVKIGVSAEADAGSKFEDIEDVYELQEQLAEELIKSFFNVADMVMSELEK